MDETTKTLIELAKSEFTVEISRSLGESMLIIMKRGRLHYSRHMFFSAFEDSDFNLLPLELHSMEREMLSNPIRKPPTAAAERPDEPAKPMYWDDEQCRWLPTPRPRSDPR